MSGWRNPHLWYITVIMIVLAVFYYLPNIITLMGGEVPNWVILNMPHDLHRSLFSIPVLYAAYKFRIKGVIVIVSISSRPDSILDKSKISFIIPNKLSAEIFIISTYSFCSS